MGIWILAIWHRILSFFWRLIFPSVIWPKELDLQNTQTRDSWRSSEYHQVICILSEHFFANKNPPGLRQPSALLGNGLASHLGLRIHLNNGWDPPTVNAPGNRSKSKKENHLPTNDFQKRTVSLREDILGSFGTSVFAPAKEGIAEKFAKR